MRIIRSLSYGVVSLTETPWRETPWTESPWTEPPYRHPPPGQTPPYRDPLDRDPSGQRPPWTKTPPGQRPTSGQRPPGQRAPSPVNRITDRCKSITFPQLRLRMVLKLWNPKQECLFLYKIFYLLTTCTTHKFSHKLH